MLRLLQSRGEIAVHFIERLLQGLVALCEIFLPLWIEFHQVGVHVFRNDFGVAHRHPHMGVHIALIGIVAVQKLDTFRGVDDR